MPARLHNEVVSTLIRFTPTNLLHNIPASVQKRMGISERNLPVVFVSDMAGGVLFFVDTKSEVNFIHVRDCKGASIRWC